MSKLTSMDMMFLLLETPARQMHMAAYQLFRLPARQKTTFVRRLLEASRTGEVGKPFNQKLKWLDKGVASWETAAVDLHYHVRYLAVPGAGKMQDFFDIVSFLNASLLDRARPLWECYVIEGIEDEQFAIFIKIHHALIDGLGAMKLFDRVLSTDPKDTRLRTAWMPDDKEPAQRSRKGRAERPTFLKRMGKLPAGLIDVGAGLADLGAQNLRLKRPTAALPFGATDTLFNNPPSSSERRYANCEIPVDGVKRIARATGTTVNDVIMTIIDDALHAYLKEQDAGIDKPLVGAMAMSIRSGEGEAAGNQVSIELVPMGEPGASITERLRQVHASTSQIKEKSSKLPNAVRQLYSLVITGTTLLPELVSAFKSIPSGNLVISNMIGPREQLYLAGAPLVALHGLPIVPPGGGLNVTFATLNQTICLAVGAAPEAVGNPYRLTQLMLAALARLAKTVPGRKTARAPRLKKSA